MRLMYSQQLKEYFGASTGGIEHISRSRGITGGFIRGSKKFQQGFKAPGVV